MNVDELQQILDWAGSVDMTTLDIADQLKLLQALSAYADAVKPIMLKCKVASPQTFITRL